MDTTQFQGIGWPSPKTRTASETSVDSGASEDGEDSGEEADSADEGDSGDVDDILVLEDSGPTLDIGVPGDELFSDFCPPGHVLAGIEGKHAEGQVTHMRGICSFATEIDDDAQVRFERGEGTTWRGVEEPKGVPELWERPCPPNFIVSSATVYSEQWGLTGVRIECASLELDDDAEGLQYGSFENLEIVGYEAMAPQTLSCPGGTPAGWRASFDGVGVRKIGMNCRTVAVGDG